MVEPFKHRPAVRADGKEPSRLQRSDLASLFGVGRWLAQHWPFGSSAARLLVQARTAFVETLAGIPATSCGELPQRLAQAASIEELWHQRSALYSVVARHLDQAEAEQRLRELNRHFAPGAARSGFGALSARQPSVQKLRTSKGGKTGVRHR